MDTVAGLAISTHYRVDFPSLNVIFGVLEPIINVCMKKVCISIFTVHRKKVLNTLVGLVQKAANWLQLSGGGGA